MRRGCEALERIFRPVFRYNIIRVMLSDLESDLSVTAQLSLLPTTGERGNRLMAVLDRVSGEGDGVHGGHRYKEGLEKVPGKAAVEVHHRLE